MARNRYPRDLLIAGLLALASPVSAQEPPAAPVEAHRQAQP
jgi:hypothetical protein